uniref:Salivary lipocalin n=1 Tax=Triatoma infestans TaxID=30076 RepID=A6YPE6_TRIIF|nr:salivary lipocalin [Triatoma infestans]
MKTFIALTFIGILTYAYAQSSGISECKTVKAKTDFSAKRFFTGTWFVSHVQKRTSSTVCQTFTASTPSEGKYIVEYTYQSHTGEQRNVRCEAEKGEDLKLTFTCTSGDTTFEAVFVIMSTDYDNYALFYRCVSFPKGYKDDNYLVLSRTSGGQVIPASLKSLTSDLQLQSCVNIMTVVL